MKPLKPGRLVTIGPFVYRAKARTNGCEGCDLHDLILCPGIKIRGKSQLNCAIDGIILKRVNP